MSTTKGSADQGDFAPGNVPRDPALAGFVGRRRAVYGGNPDPDGNRADRRAFVKATRKARRKAR